MKKQRIFTSAVLAGNLLFGNLKQNDVKTQKYLNPIPVTQEKVISNQEFNSLDGSQNSGKIIQTGNGTILEFQQEISETSSTDMDEVILVKDNGILPGAEALPIISNSRKTHRIPRIRGKHFKNELPKVKFGTTQKAAKVRSFTEVDTGLNGQRENQCPKPEFDKYKVYKEMSSTLSKISTKVRKDKQTSKSLDKLEEHLKNGEFHAGRGAQKLEGTETVFYMRAGNRARLFFKYSDKENGAVEVIAESNKDKEQQVIDNLKQNYQ